VVLGQDAGPISGIRASALPARERSSGLIARGLWWANGATWSWRSFLGRGMATSVAAGATAAGVIGVPEPDGVTPRPPRRGPPSRRSWPRSRVRSRPIAKRSRTAVRPRLAANGRSGRSESGSSGWRG